MTASRQARSRRLHWRPAVIMLLAVAASRPARGVTIASNAQAAIGQPNFIVNGLNVASATGLFYPYEIAQDRSVTQTRLYVADTFNSLFAQTASGVQNLGGLNGSGNSNIPLTIDSETQFHFTRPAAALGGGAYVMAINPPFIPYSSSGVGPSGGFLFP
jgi:hypothetical protein